MSRQISAGTAATKRQPDPEIRYRKQCPNLSSLGLPCRKPGKAVHDGGKIRPTAALRHLADCKCDSTTEQRHISETSATGSRHRLCSQDSHGGYAPRRARTEYV